jgi:hypothetical protein
MVLYRASMPKYLAGSSAQPERLAHTSHKWIAAQLPHHPSGDSCGRLEAVARAISRMFMTCSCVVPLRSVTSHLPSGSACAAVVALLTFVTACGDGSQTSRSTARKPKPPVEVDAGESCPSFDADYRDEHKACQADADCETVLVQVSCSGTDKVFGVAIDLREDFDRCAPTADGFSSCIGKPSPTRAEDGRSSSKADGSDAVARCIAGKCQARIEERQCGEKVCRAGELCVAFQGSAGLLEYECAPNPCTSMLDCTCAEPVCKLHSDQLRTCAIDQIAESDVFCKTVRR